MSDSNERTSEIAHIRSPSISNVSMSFKEFTSQHENQEIVKQIAEGLGEQRFNELKNDKEVTVENVKSELETKVNQNRNFQQTELNRQEAKNLESQARDTTENMDILSQNIPGILQALEKAFEKTTAASPEEKAHGQQEKGPGAETKVPEQKTEGVNPSEIGTISPTQTPHIQSANKGQTLKRG